MTNAWRSYSPLLLLRPDAGNTHHPDIHATATAHTRGTQFVTAPLGGTRSPPTTAQIRKARKNDAGLRKYVYGGSKKILNCSATDTREPITKTRPIRTRRHDPVKRQKTISGGSSVTKAIAESKPRA